MAIKNLKAKEGNVDIVVDIVDVGEVRQFEKFGRTGSVATAVAKDDTGDIKLTLWNEDIDKVKAGDKVHIINGYVNEWQGEKQLTTGKFGKLEIIGESEEAKKKITAEADEEEDREIYKKAKKKIEEADELEEAEELDEEPFTDEEEIE